jgi:hypothetical protein
VVRRALNVSVLVIVSVPLLVVVLSTVVLVVVADETVLTVVTPVSVMLSDELTVELVE